MVLDYNSGIFPDVRAPHLPFSNIEPSNHITNPGGGGACVTARSLGASRSLTAALKVKDQDVGPETLHCSLMYMSGRNQESSIKGCAAHPVTACAAARAS